MEAKLAPWGFCLNACEVKQDNIHIMEGERDIHQASVLLGLWNPEEERQMCYSWKTKLKGKAIAWFVLRWKHKKDLVKEMAEVEESGEFLFQWTSVISYVKMLVYTKLLDILIIFFYLYFSRQGLSV